MKEIWNKLILTLSTVVCIWLLWKTVQQDIYLYIFSLVIFENMFLD